MNTNVEIIRRHNYTDRHSTLIVREGNAWACVNWDSQNGQVTSKDGSYATSLGKNAISYVTDWCSRSTAYRRFNYQRDN